MPSVCPLALRQPEVGALWSAGGSRRHESASRFWFVRPDSSELNGRRYATVARACGGGGDESAVRARDRLNGFARSLKPLAESGGLQVEGVGGFRGGQIQDFAKHVGESM